MAVRHEPAPLAARRRRRWRLPHRALRAEKGNRLRRRNSAIDEYDPVRDRWTGRVARQADFLPSVAALDPESELVVTNSYRPGVIVYKVGSDGALTERTFV